MRDMDKADAVQHMGSHYAHKRNSRPMSKCTQAYNSQTNGPKALRAAARTTEIGWQRWHKDQLPLFYLPARNRQQVSATRYI